MRRSAAILIAAAVVAGAAPADVPIEKVGRVERLPQVASPHWVFVADVLLRRSSLVDLDRGAFLGMISTGYLSPSAAFPRGVREFYLPETYYSRGSRGERVDTVTFYDAGTLAAVDEVIIPAKRAINVLVVANHALSDDDRFLAVFNMTPATSLSIVDVERRAFVTEIAIPGCSLVYAAGPRRFLSICSDGSLLTVSVDDDGREAAKVRSARFFDPMTDPVTEKAVRYGNRWIFVSFEGRVHTIDVSGTVPRFEDVWSLVDDEDRGDDWRIGGSQHLAVHQATGRLYSLMHRGGEDTHKEPGSEVWVYDLATHERIDRITLRHPGLSFLSETVEFGRSWIWPFNRIWDLLLDNAVPNPGSNLVQVTQDSAPLLVTGSQIGGSIAVYDGLSGEFLRRVSSGNLTTHGLQAPFTGEAGAP